MKPTAICLRFNNGLKVIAKRKLLSFLFYEDLFGYADKNTIIQYTLKNKCIIINIYKQCYHNCIGD